MMYTRHTSPIATALFVGVIYTIGFTQRIRRTIHSLRLRDVDAMEINSGALRAMSLKLAALSRYQSETSRQILLVQRSGQIP